MNTHDRFNRLRLHYVFGVHPFGRNPTHKGLDWLDDIAKIDTKGPPKAATYSCTTLSKGVYNEVGTRIAIHEREAGFTLPDIIRPGLSFWLGREGCPD